MQCANPKCNTEFYPTTYNRKFCSRRCRKSFHDRLERDRDRQRVEGTFTEERPRTPEQTEYLVRQAEALLAERGGAAPSSKNLDSVLQDLGYSGKQKDEKK